MVSCRFSLKSTKAFVVWMLDLLAWRIPGPIGQDLPRAHFYRQFRRFGCQCQIYCGYHFFLNMFSGNRRVCHCFPMVFIIFPWFSHDFPMVFQCFPMVVHRFPMVLSHEKLEIFVGKNTPHAVILQEPRRASALRKRPGRKN